MPRRFVQRRGMPSDSPIWVLGQTFFEPYLDAMSKAPKKPSRKVTWATVRDLALAMPGAEESTSYRMPAMKVRGNSRRDNPPMVGLSDDGLASSLRSRCGEAPCDRPR
jgi:hypothetical protein